MCEPKARAGGRTIGAGISLAGLAAAATGLNEALLIAEDAAAIITALAVIGLVAVLWRAGVVAASVRAGARTTTWSVTQVRGLAAGQARRRARSRLAIRARGLGELPPGQGPVVGRVVGRPARLGVPRWARVTAGDDSQATTIRLPGVVAPGQEPVVLLVEEVGDLLSRFGVDSEKWQRELIAAAMNHPGRLAPPTWRRGG
jgi:hypothetical protein